MASFNQSKINLVICRGMEAYVPIFCNVIPLFFETFVLFFTQRQIFIVVATTSFQLRRTSKLAGLCFKRWAESSHIIADIESRVYGMFNMQT